jgi:hypothetical protein
VDLVSTLFLVQAEEQLVDDLVGHGLDREYIERELLGHPIDDGLTSDDFRALRETLEQYRLLASGVRPRLDGKPRQRMRPAVPPQRRTHIEPK